MAAFGLVFRVPYLYDDKVRILESAAVQGTWPGWGFWLSYAYGDGEYEPLVFVIHWILRRFSDGTFLLRLTSLLLHAANAWLAWRLLRRVMGDASMALWAAVLFSLFPAHVETLAISTFKKHLLVAFFGLALLNVQSEPRLGRGPRLILALLCQGAALLSRESALILPFLSLLTAWFLGGVPALRRDAPLHGGLFAFSGLYALGRLLYLPHAAAALAGENWFYHAATCGKAFLWDLRQLAIPGRLGLEHSLAPVSTGVEAGLILLGVLGTILITKKLSATEKKKEMGLGLAWMAVALLPSLNLYPFANFSLVADRYLYLPAVGFSVFSVNWLKDRRLLSLLAAAYVAAAAVHMARFTDPLALWEHAARRAPGNPRALGAWGAALKERGRFSEAESALRRAVAAGPDYPEPAFDLALLLSGEERDAEAAAVAGEALARHPSSRAYNNLGLVLLKAGRSREARPALESAANLAPRDSDVALNLGLCYLALGMDGRAQARLVFASFDREARPSALEALGELAMRRGDKARALAFFELALDEEPRRWNTLKRAARLQAGMGRGREARERLARYQALLESHPPPKGSAPSVIAVWRGLVEQARLEQDGLSR